MVAKATMAGTLVMARLCTDMYEDWVVITEERDFGDENPDIRDHDLPWYRGRMNRSVAEDRLSRSQRFDGTFTVRESDMLFGDLLSHSYTLHFQCFYIL